MIVYVCVCECECVREQEKRDENQINLLIYGTVDLSRHFFSHLPQRKDQNICTYHRITKVPGPTVPLSRRGNRFRHEFLINKASSWHIPQNLREVV